MDNYAFGIASIDTIKINIIHTIQGVLHVTGKRETHLLLGQLDEFGCSIHARQGIMKFVRGALVVKAEKIVIDLDMILGERFKR